MTNETEAPERIPAGKWCKCGFPHETGGPCWECRRADLSDAKDKRIAKLEKELAKAVKLMELSVELATWNTTLLDDVILFIIELKGPTQ